MEAPLSPPFLNAWNRGMVLSFRLWYCFFLVTTFVPVLERSALKGGIFRSRLMPRAWECMRHEAASEGPGGFPG